MTGSALPYRLNDLGWLQFERLCELVLRAESGVRAEGWRGHADECRVTTVNEPFAFGGSRVADGPVAVVLFWCRGEPWAGSTLLDLVERWSRFIERSELEQLTGFVVCTNVAAEQTRALLKPALPRGAALTVLGAHELSQSIDAHAEIRAALPSVLGLREIGKLIAPDARANSTFDIDQAQRLARIFWPTRAYARARAVLERHRFVVLTGPPEMGKTAIAEMIALAQMTDGWDAHACTDPDQVGRKFDPARRQVFIADDAFGSTEYRPDSAERWAQSLAELLQMLDHQHWLIWTSRPAPLKAGLSRIQRERGAERFPSPGAVLVDAGDLDLEEKTLILFRHAKTQGLVGPARGFVRSSGVFIVEHPHFTPERIRRFVIEHLREPPRSYEDLRLAADHVLSSPTNAMRNSFGGLGQEHRDLLVALLDAPAGLIDERELTAAVRRHHPGGLSRPPAELIDRLTDHFLKVTPLGIGWVHPSWRDLVIEQLRESGADRQRFLAVCGVEGATLALSREGGGGGERAFPLLESDADWDQLSDRLHRLIPELEPRDTARVLLALRQSLDGPVDARQRVEAQSLAGAVLNATRDLWDRRQVPLAPFLLDAWYQLRFGISDRTEPPKIAATWAELHPGTWLIEHPDREELLRADDWLAFAQVLRTRDPVALGWSGFYERDQELLQRLLVALTSTSFANPELRPLGESVLGRIRDLCPDLAAGASGALTLTRMAADLDAKRWWVPEDLSSPPSADLAYADSRFERIDVIRVLEDL